jgi:hypothetical protein
MLNLGHIFGEKSASYGPGNMVLHDFNCVNNIALCVSYTQYVFSNSNQLTHQIQIGVFNPHIMFGLQVDFKSEVIVLIQTKM